VFEALGHTLGIRAASGFMFATSGTYAKPDPPEVGEVTGVGEGVGLEEALGLGVGDEDCVGDGLGDGDDVGGGDGEKDGDGAGALADAVGVGLELAFGFGPEPAFGLELPATRSELIVSRVVFTAEPGAEAAWQPRADTRCATCLPGPIPTVDDLRHLIVESVITVPVAPGTMSIAKLPPAETVVCLMTTSLAKTRIGPFTVLPVTTVPARRTTRPGCVVADRLATLARFPMLRAAWLRFDVAAAGTLPNCAGSVIATAAHAPPTTRVRTVLLR